MSSANCGRTAEFPVCSVCRLWPFYTVPQTEPAQAQISVCVVQGSAGWQVLVSDVRTVFGVHLQGLEGEIPALPYCQEELYLSAP